MKRHHIIAVCCSVALLVCRTAEILWLQDSEGFLHDSVRWIRIIPLAIIIISALLLMREYKKTEIRRRPVLAGILMFATGAIVISAFIYRIVTIDLHLPVPHATPHIARLERARFYLLIATMVLSVAVVAWVVLRGINLIFGDNRRLYGGLLAPAILAAWIRILYVYISEPVNNTDTNALVSIVGMMFIGIAFSKYAISHYNNAENVASRVVSTLCMCFAAGTILPTAISNIANGSSELFVLLLTAVCCAGAGMLPSAAAEKTEKETE